MPEFRYLPSEARADAPLWGHLTGLEPRQPVEVRLELTDALGHIWRSSAVYRASAAGTVDLAAGAPQKAAWQGSDAYGLYWSLKCADAPTNPYGLDTCFEVATASLAPLKVEIGAYINDAYTKGQLIARGEWTREFVLRASCESWRDDLVGHLFVPETLERSAGVLVLGGSQGGFAWANQVAALIAASGRAALALAYFDWQGRYGLPSSLSEIALETFTRGLERLKAHPRVSEDEVAVVGFSKGAEAALLLASKRADISRVVAYSPSAYSWEAARTGAAPVRSSWTWQGEPLPFAQFAADFYGRFDKTLLRPLHERTIASGKAEGARIALESSSADILLISGGQDSVWPSAAMSESLVEAGSKAATKANISHLHFEEAGHTFLPPGMPGERLDGSPKANAQADRKSWGALREHLGLS